MTEDVTVTDLLASQTPAPSREFHGGVIRVYRELLAHLSIDLRGCNTQGEFEDKGVFIELHKRLLLPESYTIRALFMRWPFREWEIVVESLDLPPVENGAEPPEITPVYETRYHKFGIPGQDYILKTIKIEDRWQRTYSPDELMLERL